jgi:hypothetical protein
MFIHIDWFQPAKLAGHDCAARMIAGLPVRQRKSDRLTEVIGKFRHRVTLKFELLKPA